MATPDNKSKKTTKNSGSQINQTRVPTVKLTEDELLNTWGATGTYIVNGFLEQDYNSKLSGIEGLMKFDEMRRSDSKVRQSLMVCKLPILSTEWYVEPAVNEETGEVGDEEQEVADFVEKALFEKMEKTWQEYLIEVLTCLDFGFSLFEKTYTADEFDDHVWLKDLGFRKQVTIEKWEQENGSAGVTQQLPAPVADPESPSVGKNKVSIPTGKLLLFSYQKEGDNYAGVSVLRSAYKHWYIKDSLYKFDSIKHERQGVGIPVIKLPKNHTPQDKLEAKLILKNVRANEQGGVILPEGWEFMFADLQAGNTTDIWKSIEHHNAEIANNVLAMFLNLVSGDGGSRALSEDQSDFFLLSIESLANLIEDVHNRFLINELVDLNYDVKNYPKLRHKKLGSIDYASMVNTISTAASAGVINPDEDLEDWFRKMIDAPPRMPEPEIEVDEDGNEIDPETGEPILPEDEPETDPETGLPLDTPDDELAQIEEEDAIEDELIEASEVVEMEGRVYANHDGVWVEHYTEYGGFDGGKFTEQVRSFRIVSEETKRKISEALKKAKPGDTEQTKQRLKNEAAARKAARHQKALANARARLALRKGKKKGGVIAQRRAARLKKAGIKDSAARQNANKSAIRDTLNKGAPAKKVSKVKQATKNLLSRGKMKQAAKKKTKTVKPKKATSTKTPPVSTKTTAKGQRAAQQAKDKNSPLYKAKAAPKAPKVKSKLAQAVAKRKAARLKKRVKASEHDHAHDPSMEKYSKIFSEGAASILDIQRDVEFEKGFLPQGPQKFAEPKIWKGGWRALTFAEQKVNWKSMRSSVSKFEAALNTELDDLLGMQKQDILDQVKKAVEGNDIASLGVLKARFTGEISSALGNVQKEMFELGKSSAALEMGVNAPGTAREVMGAIKLNMQKMVKQLTDDVENAVSTAVGELIGKNAGSITNTQTAQAISAASDAIDKVHEARGAINTLTLYGSLNMGRGSIYERYPEQIYGFQFSAIIDEKTTDTCLALDGRVIKVGSPDFYLYNPPLHYECRSIFVEILNDEEFKPEETGIPSRIPAGKGIDNFKDLTVPIVEANSPAVKVLQDELEERMEKIAELQKSGLYPNRLTAHQQRVNNLRLALSDNAAKIALPKEIKLADGTKAETRSGYLYHATPKKNLDSISESGLQPRVSKLDEATKAERVYLTPIPDIAGSGIDMNKDGDVLIRVRADLATKPEQDPHIPVPGGSLYTTHGFDPEDLEVQQGDGSWKPLVDSDE